ncbi:hypothetical protein Tco_0837332 [Tanacetum coccineum]
MVSMVSIYLLSSRTSVIQELNERPVRVSLATAHAPRTELGCTSRKEETHQVNGECNVVVDEKLVKTPKLDWFDGICVPHGEVDCIFVSKQCVFIEAFPNFINLSLMGSHVPFDEIWHK